MLYWSVYIVFAIWVHFSESATLLWTLLRFRWLKAASSNSIMIELNNHMENLGNLSSLVQLNTSDLYSGISDSSREIGNRTFLAGLLKGSLRSHAIAQ